MVQLTRQESKVLALILALLLVGWGVKAYRAAHPPSNSAGTGASGDKAN